MNTLEMIKTLSNTENGNSEITITMKTPNRNPNILDYILPNRLRMNTEVNSSLVSINQQTHDEKVKAISNFLLANPNTKFTATFIKKDNTLRSLTFLGRNEWNRLNGITSTWSGRRMVASKAARDMMTVVEICNENGKVVIQPRTLNVGTILDLRLAA